MTTETIQVEGMSCDHCKHAVESALTNLNGVSSADVSLEDNNVTVNYDETDVSFDNMKDAIEDQGYDVK
ncbi:MULTISPECIES: copper chaperone CopZ [Staphylococcus]|uniref:Copper chaperone CopZ n=1 Tax=Staphylococcus hsinchuensis TaxID=3051183 RepID=A0ABZ3EDJ6_9STAP|nr:MULTISPECIES: copper chaperone CopZ [unclassified Staphylococcus]